MASFSDSNSDLEMCIFLCFSGSCENMPGTRNGLEICVLMQ